MYMSLPAMVTTTDLYEVTVLEDRSEVIANDMLASGKVLIADPVLATEEKLGHN